MFNASADRGATKIISGEPKSGHLSYGLTNRIETLRMANIVLGNRPRILSDSFNDRISRDFQNISHFAADELRAFRFGKAMNFRLADSSDEACEKDVTNRRAPGK